eukprot:gene13609-14995_t
MRPTSDAIISTTGLTFLEARNRIQNVLGNVLEFFKEVQSKQSWNKVFQDKSFQLWIGLSCFTFLIYLFSLIFTGIAAYQPGLIFTLIVFGILFLVNFICLIQSHRINQIELSTLIQSIIQQYQSYLAQQVKVLSDQNLNNFQAIQIPSGHSQVSIVHVYRHHQWMRIPVLLLAEGDIIALMGGDITPCQVYELKVVSVTLHHATTKKSSESELKWMKTKLITTGEKIYIDLEESASAAHDDNNHEQHHHSRHRTTSNDNGDADDHDDLHDHDFDAPLHTHHRHKSNESHHHHQSASSSKKTHAENRHRSLGPESVEILRLCGNIRCFLVAETPIESYIHTIYSQQLAIAERNQQTFLFKLRDALIVEGSKILFIIAVVMIILAIIRLILFNECRLEYFLTFLIPVGNIILIATPINIPLIQLLLKSFSIAEILSTLEAALSYSDHSNRGNINSMNNNNNGINSNLNSPNNTQPTRMSMNIVSAASPTQNSSNLRKESNATFGSSIRNPVHHEPVASEEAHSPRRHTHQAEEEAMNEFVDEDLDERVDDIAEETAMKVGYGRYLHYVYKILSTRLFLGHIEKVADNEGSQSSKNSLELLPIPLASINITEQLGAITMVCFVDDDIISENYSVTEEIFLLSENIEKENESSGNKLQPGSDYKSYKSTTTTTAPNGDGFGGTSGVPFNSGKGSYTKGTVLDLHANPEATGSRFENPLWWKFLTCLKPLGMNALLTYQHTAENLQNPSTGSVDLSAGMNGGPFGPNIGIGASFSGRMKSYNTSFSVAPNVATMTENPLIEAQSNNNPRDTKPNSSTSSIIDIERGLVRHIRKTMPLEFLRELAEEIGFLSDDLQTFQKAIEVNVIAPGLQNAHLLEDNHVWGQDETRRRGSLLPTLRGGVYRDVRSGGGLQMMSLGDPSLVLNYCKEYWDGNTRSITPLSAADRAEVLAVFDRWRLEDFDVVAFSYSPMPVAPLLYFTNEQGLDQNLSSRKSFMSTNNAPIVTGNPANFQPTIETKSPAIFFVDPSKPHELMGGKARKKSVIAATNPAMKSGAHGEQTDTRSVRVKERPETIPEEDTLIRESSGTAGGDGILKSSKSGSHPGLIELKIEPRLTVSEKIITNTTKQLHLSPVTPREKLDENNEEDEGSPLIRQETVTEILPLTYDNLHHQDDVIPIDTSGLEEEENAFIRSKTVPTYAMKSTAGHQKFSSPAKIPKSISGDVNDLHNHPNAMTASDRGETQSFMGESWDDSIQASLENIDSHLPPHLRNVAATVAGSVINDNFSEKIAKLRNRGLRKSLSDSNLAVKALAGSRVHGDDDLLMQRDDSSLLFSPMPYDESEKKFTFERTTSLGLSIGAPPSPNPSSASHTPVNSMPNSPVNLSRVNSRSAKKFEGDLEDDETDSVHNILHRAGSSKKKGFSPLPTVPQDERDRRGEGDAIQHRSPSLTLKPQPNFHQQMINRSAGKKDSELTKGVSLESVRSGYKYQALSSDLEDMSIDMQESQSRSQSYSRSMYVKPLSHHPFTA